MGLSWQIWISAGRAFPVLPFGVFPRLPIWMEVVLVFLLANSLVGAVIVPRRRAALTAVALIALCILAACDQMRWQPWVYQYGLSLIPFLWLRESDGVAPDADALALTVQRMILVATYFWSGFHKFGKGFHEAWTRSVAMPLLEKLDGVMHEFVSDLWRTVAPMEIAIAVALVFAPTRRLGVVMACFSHLVILALIGPLLGNRNAVIWPWNVCMIALVVVLFWPRQTAQSPRRSRTQRAGTIWNTAPSLQKVSFAVIAVLVCLMPAFSIARLWDRYLSFHLYSGQQHRCVWAMTRSGFTKLPEKYRPFARELPSNLHSLSAGRWAFDELNAPMISEDRVMLDWCKAIIELGFDDGDGFFYHDMPYFLEEHGSARFKPSEIRSMRDFPPLPGKPITPSEQGPRPPDAG